MTNEIERCRKWIEDALEYSGGTHDFEDVVDGIRAGTMQLWPAPKGCVVTEIVSYPKKKVIHIFLAGGELDQILDMYDDVSEFGRSNGCVKMTLAGRRGWKKVLSDWKEQFIVLGIDIEDKT